MSPTKGTTLPTLVWKRLIGSEMADFGTNQDNFVRSEEKDLKQTSSSFLRTAEWPQGWNLLKPQRLRRKTDVRIFLMDHRPTINHVYAVVWTAMLLFTSSLIIACNRKTLHALSNICIIVLNTNVRVYGVAYNRWALNIQIGNTFQISIFNWDNINLTPACHFWTA